MIEFEKLTYTYINGDDGVKNVNLKINAGEFVVLCGKSGCGKTTLTRIINGLAFHFYKGKYSGKASIGGNDISEMSSDAISKRVGSVFQDPKSQFFDKYVEGEVAFGCENIGMRSPELADRVNKSVEELGISHLRNRKLFSLSSGEKQKTAMASIIAMTPDIYVLDEPSANLDKNATAELCKILKNLKAEGKIVVISEHRVSYLNDLADRYIYLKNGSIEAEYTREKFSAFSEQELYQKGLRTNREPLLSVAPTKKDISLSDTLEIKELSASHKKNKALFEGFNLSAHSGEVIAVMGDNGTGKTTLLRILSGLRRPKNGKVCLNGKLLSVRKRLKNFFLVLNGADNRPLTNQVCDEPLYGCGKKEAESKRGQCDELLENMNLTSAYDRHPLTLSGGQKQRLSIVTALMQERQALLLDEPTSGLDYDNMIQVSAAIKAAAAQGKIVIIVSHDIEFVNSTADRIAFL